jgi:hypothetical protein
VENARPVKPEHRCKLELWFLEQVEAFRAKGLTDDLLQEPSVRESIYRTSLQKHHSEILADPELVDSIVVEGLKVATPTELRQMAKADRERGYFDAACELEWLADLLERGTSEI